MNFTELSAALSEMGLPSYRTKQIYSWIHQKCALDYDEMTNLPLSLRERLKEELPLRKCTIERKQVSAEDGTVKYLFCFGGNEYAESVLMKYKYGYTICVSTQIGCKMGCSFCASTLGGYVRSLLPSEILGQIYTAQRDENIRISHIVLMGMGEPLDNLDEVLKALELLTATYGYAWSPKRITLSTVGLRKGLKRFIEESDCHLAISLHSPLAVQRSELMPAEKGYSITEMVELLKNYDFSKQRRLSFEYIVFKGLNDSQVYDKELLKLLRGLDCRINLIRFHAIPGVDLEGADMDTMTRFRDYLTTHGLFTTIRASRGEDIFAACGMLSTAKQEENSKS